MSGDGAKTLGVTRDRTFQGGTPMTPSSTTLDAVDLFGHLRTLKGRVADEIAAWALVFLDG